MKKKIQKGFAMFTVLSILALAGGVGGTVVVLSEGNQPSQSAFLSD